MAEGNVVVENLEICFSAGLAAIAYCNTPAAVDKFVFFDLDTAVMHTIYHYPSIQRLVRTRRADSFDGIVFDHHLRGIVGLRSFRICNAGIAEVTIKKDAPVRVGDIIIGNHHA